MALHSLIQADIEQKTEGSKGDRVISWIQESFEVWICFHSPGFIHLLSLSWAMFTRTSMHAAEEWWCFDLDRKSGEAHEEVETRIALPAVTFQSPLLRVETEYPRSTPAGQAFRAEFTISNLTPQLQQLSLVVGDASGFVIAGKAHVTLLLQSCQACFPLSAITNTAIQISCCYHSQVALQKRIVLYLQSISYNFHCQGRSCQHACLALISWHINL